MLSSTLLPLAIAFIHTTTAAPTLESNVHYKAPENSTTEAVEFYSRTTLTDRTSKRGVPYNNADFARMFDFDGSKVGWAYNWDQKRNGNIGGLKFSPMLWGPGGIDGWRANAEAAINSQPTDNEILFYNEPDMCKPGAGGSCVSVEDSVRDYKDHINPLLPLGVLAGTPAVTNAKGDHVGLKFLWDFLVKCDKQCKYDFTTIHWYGPSGAAGAAQMKQQIIDAYVTGAGKKVWITEFAPEGGSEDDAIEFLSIILPWMDSEWMVGKYSYFFAAPGKLINNEGTGLSRLGQFYATA